MPLRPRSGRPLLLLALLTAVLPAVAGPGAEARAQAKPRPRTDPALAQLRKGHTAFRAGDYAGAAKLLAGLAPRLPRVRDYVLYFAGESEFFAGNAARARTLFSELEKQKSSRLQLLGAYRVADCLWTAGDRKQAVARYRKLLGPSAEGEKPSERLSRTRANQAAAVGNVGPDVAVARYRVALMLEEQDKDRAARAFRTLHVEFPAHPLAAEALARATTLAPPPATATTSDTATPEERLRRAERLAEDRLFEAAVAELGKLSGVTGPLAAERDFQLGMTKFKMRRDYAGAAKLLLAAEPSFTGEKAATAAFHGVRALSRVNRIDEAITGYHRVVSSYGSSRWAPEAQFLAGWLELNRMRPKQSIPGLEETVRRYPRTEFAADAAWFVALSHILLGDGQQALPALDRYQKLAGPRSNHPEHGFGAAARRTQYFRARALGLLGRHEESKRLYEDLCKREPFSYYGVLARARLRERGTPPALALPTWTGDLPSIPASAAREPLLKRVDDLVAAGLEVEAGLELVRGESALMSKLGRDRALAVLFDKYPQVQQWRRAYQLAESHGDAALASAPKGDARVFWEASYPRAFAELVDRYGPAEGNPPWFLLSIIRKESGFLPTEVSYADARGLVQVLPETAAKLAAELNIPFAPEQLYVPEVAVRLGARYLGGLAKKFGGNVALAAGAYNGGAPATKHWCDKSGTRPLDEFVELVGNDQSREYIRRVLAILSRYHYLYEGKPWEPSLKMDGCRYRADGPNY